MLHHGTYANRVHRWERGGGTSRVRTVGGDRDLSDHAGVADGRGGRHVGVRRIGRTCSAPCPRSSRCSPRPAPPERCTGRCRPGSLATTFTASQGLLLMLPNMFKIAGELTPTVIHVAARSLATHALSIFGDHSDVMAARTTGLRDAVRRIGAGGARLRRGRPRRHAADARAVPALLRRLPDLARDQPGRVARRRRAASRSWHGPAIDEHRLRRLRPTAPVVRGTAQNPDVFFQAREASTPWHGRVPGVVSDVFDELAAATGRRYSLVDYEGAPDAERVVVLMGSGSGAAGETVGRLVADGRTGRGAHGETVPSVPGRSVPRGAAAQRAIGRGARPHQGTGLGRGTAVPGRRHVLAEAGRHDVRVIGGRYGLGSKEFTPAMVKAVFDDLASDSPRRRFTVGINDDVSHTSLTSTRRSGFRPATGRRSSRRSGATGRSARTRPRSRSSVRTPTCTHRATSSTTPRSRGR